jgi:hypothetical protein
MFGLYKKYPKKDIEKMSDEYLIEEVNGNSNIMDTYEDHHHEEGLTVLEKQFYMELDNENHDLVEELHRRNKLRRK